MKKAIAFILELIVKVVCEVLDNTALLGCACVYMAFDVESLPVSTKAIMYGMVFIVLAVDRIRWQMRRNSK